MKGKLKYYKRAGVYKNSTGSNKFNPETLEAHSYDWWKYVAKIDGKVVFNNYSYSVTTSGHQSAMRSLLSELGIKIDLFIEAPQGLDKLCQELEWNKSKYEKSDQKLKKARKEHTQQHWFAQRWNAANAIEFLNQVGVQ